MTTKKRKVVKEGDKCPDCGGELIVALVCKDDACGGTIHPADDYRIQTRCEENIKALEEEIGRLKSIMETAGIA